jgi:hypothetical protein
MSALNRRQLLQAGALASALAPMEFAMGSALAGLPAWGTVDVLLVDQRLAAAAPVAAAAAQAGVRVLPLPRDVLPLWHEQLLPAVRKEQRQAIAGVTTGRGLFALSTLAADHRLHLRFIAENVTDELRATGQWVAAQPSRRYELESPSVLSWIIT